MTAVKPTPQERADKFVMDRLIDSTFLKEDDGRRIRVRRNILETDLARVIRDAEARGLEEAAALAGDRICGCGDHQTELADQFRALAAARRKP